MDVKTILNSLGLTLKRENNYYYRAAANFRNGDNPNALRISSKNGNWVDFVAQERGSLKDLICLIKGIKLPEAESYLRQNEFFQERKEEKLPLVENKVKVFDAKILDRLIRDNTYWNNRGISDETLTKFKGGVALTGKLYQRYVFPIFKEDKLIGFAARDITEKNEVKWILYGKKTEWVFPFFNLDFIKESQTVILIESIGDCLKLMEAGIYNCLCLFGLQISDAIISKLNGLNLKKIYISTNNDENGRGNEAAQKIYDRLSRFFNLDKLEIKLPPEGINDFGEMSVEDILNWNKVKN